MENMKEFLDSFYEKMKKRGKIYDKEEKKNFENLYNALENNDYVGIQIFALGMGDGKSTFIQEYCKYKMKTESNFANMLVNRTIKECIDTCISLEVKDEYKEKYKNYKKEELDFLYKGEQHFGYYAQEPHLDYFNAITISGFNKEQCLKYNELLPCFPKKTKVSESSEETIEWEEMLLENSYQVDDSMCIHCNKPCLKRMSKEMARNHKTIAISHNRLFNFNDITEMLAGLLYYKNKNGDSIKRKQLIIDEKLAMADIGILTMKDIVTIKEELGKIGIPEEHKQIQDFIKIFDTLGKPTNNKEMIKKEIKGAFPPFILSDDTKKFFLKKSKKLRETIQILEKLHKYEICVISEIYMAKKEQKEKRQFTFARYVDLLGYINTFGNVILLDGTADLDLEYKKSKVKLNNRIKRKKKKINLFIPYNPCNLSKTTLQNHIRNRKDEIVIKMAEECDNIIETTGEKTLIVTYKSAFKNDNFESRLSKYIESDKKKYKIIHFGQYTTGVNFLSDYKNIIFLGQLRKPPAYYKAKSIILSNEQKQYNVADVKYNEMLIDTIQQIGRTCYRKNGIPNVYIFDNEEITSFLKDNLTEYFETVEKVYYNENLFVERKEYDKLGKVDIKSYKNKFFEYIYYFLKQEEETTKWIDNQYVFKVPQIKQAIGYNSKNFGRVVQNIKEVTTDNFIAHNARAKTIILNLEELMKISSPH